MRGGDVRRHRLANAGDARRKEPARQRKRPRRAQRIHHRFGVLAEPTSRNLQRGETFLREREEIEGVGDPALLHERIHRRLAQRPDVQRVARGEMLHTPPQLRRTARVHAPQRHLLRETFHLAAADRTGGRHLEHLLRARALFRDRRFDRGDHVPRLHEPHMVADADILPRDLVGIVQRRAGDRRSRQLHRTQLGDRRQHARPTDLHGDALQHRLRALGRVLVGARPPRTVRRRPERRIEIAFVQLHDRAVDLEAEGMPPRLKFVNRRKDLLHRRARPRPRRHGETPAAERRDHLRVRLEALASHAARVVDDDI